MEVNKEACVVQDTEMDLKVRKPTDLHSNCGSAEPIINPATLGKTLLPEILCPPVLHDE